MCRAQVVLCTWLIKLLLLGTFSLVDLVIGPLPTTDADFLPAARLAPLAGDDDDDDTFSNDFCCLPGGGGDSTVDGSGGSGWCGDGGDGSPAVRSSTTTTVTCRSSDSGLMMPSFVVPPQQSTPARPATGDAEYDACDNGLQLMCVGDVDCDCWCADGAYRCGWYAAGRCCWYGPAADALFAAIVPVSDWSRCSSCA